MITIFLVFFKKSPLLAFIKFEPTFLRGSLAVCLSAPIQGEAGGRGVWGELARPSSTLRVSDPNGLRGLASRFSGKFQAVLNSVRPKAGFSKSL